MASNTERERGFAPASVQLVVMDVFMVGAHYGPGTSTGGDGGGSGCNGGCKLQLMGKCIDEATRGGCTVGSGADAPRHGHVC